VTEAFTDSGWPIEVAAVHAARLLGIDGVYTDPLEAETIAQEADAARLAAKGKTVLLKPDAKLYPVITEAFTNSGWSVEEAATHAARLLGMNLDDNCWLSQGWVIYCDSQQVKHYEPVWVNGHCYDDGEGEGAIQCLQMVPVCQQGAAKWMSLKTQNNCLDLPNGTCVQLRLNPPAFVPCGHGDILPCSCFQEFVGLNGIDCEEIEITCCPIKNGCPGCPDDCDE